MWAVAVREVATGRRTVVSLTPSGGVSAGEASGGPGRGGGS